MQGYHQPTGIEVKTSFFPLAFLLFACTPIIEINGHRLPRYWGTHFFELPPGRYFVKIYFAYLFMPQCGVNAREVVVEPGVVRRVRYFMWPLIFVPGDMSVY